MLGIVRSRLRLSERFSTGSWRELAADAPLHAVVAGHLAVAVLAACWLDATDRLVLLMYLSSWASSVLVVAILYVLLIALPASARSGSKTPLFDALRAARRRCGPRLLPGLAMSVGMAVFFGSFTSLKNMLPLLVPFWCDELLADLGAFLHGGRSPWFLLQPVLGYPPLTRAIEILYAPVWFLLLVGFPALLSLSPGSGPLRRRYLLATFLCFILLGNVLAGAGMSAGPVYYGEITGDTARYAALRDYLRFSSGSAFSAWDLQQHLWACWRTGSVEHGTGISAFPSLHVAMATLFALASSRIDPRLCAALTAYLAIIAIGSVHLGWHYAVDGYVSIVGASAIWWLAGRLSSPSRASQRGCEPVCPTLCPSAT